MLFNIKDGKIYPKCTVPAESPEELAEMCGGSLIKNVSLRRPILSSDWVGAIVFSKDFTPCKGLEALRKMCISRQLITHLEDAVADCLNVKFKKENALFFLQTEILQKSE